MKLIHISDLHLGKRVNELSMLEDQEYILKKIMNIIDNEKPDAILIAGDIYDKVVPATEAVELFDDFLVRLSTRKLQVFIISGNHDSAERIAFGNRLMNASGIHLSPVYNGETLPFCLSNQSEDVYIYMLPFLKPANVRRFFPDEDIKSYTDALNIAIKNMQIDRDKQNILVTHQFVTGAVRSESEDISVGGTDNVDASVFEDFDYVALGHIHSPQNAGSNLIRYSGSPLKYSFSEASQQKSVTVIEMSGKGRLNVRTVPLEPLHEMYEIKGTYNELISKSYYENTTYQDDYLHITLTDEEDIPDAIAKLRTVYHNLMKLDYDNARTRNNNVIDGAAAVENKSPIELFAELYELQNNVPMSNEQSNFMQEMIEKVWEGKQ